MLQLCPNEHNKLCTSGPQGSSSSIYIWGSCINMTRCFYTHQTVTGVALWLSFLCLGKQPQRRAKDMMGSFFYNTDMLVMRQQGWFSLLSVIILCCLLVWLHQQSALPGAAVSREMVWSTHISTLCGLKNHFGRVVLLIVFGLQTKKLPGLN